MFFKLSKALAALVCVFVLFPSVSSAQTYPSIAAVEGAFVQDHAFLDESREMVQNTLREYFDALNDDISAKRQENYSIYIYRSSIDYGVDPFLVAAVAIQRSGLVWTLSEGGRYGLMAVDWEDNKKWITQDHPRVTSRRILCKPVINVRVGADLMSRELKKAGLDYGAMISAGYAGEPGAEDAIWKHYLNLVKLFKVAVEKGRP